MTNNSQSHSISNFSIRIASIAIDTAILLALVSLLLLIVSSFHGILSPKQYLLSLFVIMMPLNWVTFLFYFSWFTIKNKQTFGQRLFKLQVMSTKKKITLFQSCIRSLLLLLLGPINILSFFVTKKKQMLHDLLSNTIVINHYPKRYSKGKLFIFEFVTLVLLIILYSLINSTARTFSIPTSSMSLTLQQGDYILTDDNVDTINNNEIIVYKHKHFEIKTYIKRCIAQSGETVEIKNGTAVYVNNKKITDVATVQYIRQGEATSDIMNFKPLYIPKRGEKLDLETTNIRSLFFYKNLIEQENLRSQVRIIVKNSNGDQIPHISSDTRFQYDWYSFNTIMLQLLSTQENIQPIIVLDGQPLNSYTVKNDLFFVMGDNRDNSLDSRYVGFISRKNVISKHAFIYYSSFNWTPRLNRIGMFYR